VGFAVETEAGQAITYRRMAQASAALPGVAGFCWTKYRDKPGENLGLLDRSGARRQQVINTVSETNGQLDLTHLRCASDYFPEYFQEDRFAGGRPRQELRNLARPVTVDGNLADWPQRGAWLENLKIARDLDPIVFCGARVGWDDKGLCLAIEVQDDAVELLDPRAYWIDADFVEVFIDGTGKRPSAYAPGCAHIVLLPRGGGPDGTAGRAMIMHHTGDRVPTNQYDARSIDIASSFFSGQREYQHVAGVGTLIRSTRVSMRESSWKLEARIPWEVIGGRPETGRKLGFNLVVHNVGQREEEAFWAAPRDQMALRSPAVWGSLVLAAADAP
jgi:hypothetical protein